MIGTAQIDSVSPESDSDVKLWRQHLHKYPELAYSEHRTSDFVAARLAQFGLVVHRGLAGTGVVGTLKRGTSRRTIAIRADMDALPIQEQSSVPYSSSTPGIMHACGHDGHVAMALGAARICARLSDLDGTVHFVFQPAEENECGGQRMVKDGLFRLFPSDSVYALHNWPALPLGACVARDGVMMAALGVFEIRITGVGCHGAMPHEGSDCILAACHVLSALHSIVSRNVDARYSAVISATQITAGDTWNVIPDVCIIRGTSRWFDEHIGDVIERRIAELSKSIASGFGCHADIRYERRIPATVNNPDAASFVRAVVRNAVPKLEVVDSIPSTGAEDFAFMLQAVPGCYILLGSGQPGRDHGLHSSRYDFNDELLPLGVGLWVSVVRWSLVNTQDGIADEINRP